MRLASGARTAVFAVFVAGIALQLAACTNKPLAMPGGQAAYQALPAPAGATADVYQLGSGDVVTVNVYGAPEMSAGSVIVDPAGEVSLPLIGPVAAEGKTTRELATIIAGRLKPRYLLNPKVSVNITQYASKHVTVEGQVMQPGVLAVTGSSTLLEVMALSRGPTPTARLREVAVFRTVGGQRMAAKFDLSAIRRGEAADPAIYGGDTVVVGFDRVEGAWRSFLQAVPAFAVFSRPFIN